MTLPPMTDRDPVTIHGMNEHFILEITIPMEDTETGEARTAVVTIPKLRLWQTADGGVVRGVVVRWKGAGA